MNALGNIEPVQAVGDVIEAVLPLVLSTVAATFVAISQTFQDIMPKYPQGDNVPENKEFDFIIIGAGTAGSVMANRLTEVEDFTVCLIEIGGTPPISSVVPGLFPLIYSGPADYDYTAVKQNHSHSLRNGEVKINSGRMLGGSSAASFMVYNRGRKEDVESWGLPEWTWPNALKYFMKFENYQIPEIANDEYLQKYHGFNGPNSVSLNTKDNKFNTIETQLLDSMAELGFKKLKDMNDPNDLGYAKVQLNIDTRTGTRSNTADDYLVPIKDRENLSILLNTLATKIIIENEKAVGVEARKDGKIIKYYARKEVIVSAGTIRSPQLLQLSGIGPKEELEALGIVVIKDLPVGKNMKDVVEVPVFIKGPRGLLSATDTASAALNLNTIPLPVIVGQYNLPNYESDRGIETIFLIWGAASPLMYLVCNINFHLEPAICDSAVISNLDNELVTPYILLKNPKSSGEIKLKTADAADDPLIYLNFFQEPEDFERLYDAFIDFIRINQTTYFKDHKLVDVGVRLCDEFVFDSPEYYRCYIRNTCQGYFQPIGTCGMSKVVDGNTMVYGIENLRVVDASVIQTLIRGEPQAYVMMIAERISDVIKELYGYCTP